jgi:hypothetical protein
MINFVVVVIVYILGFVSYLRAEEAPSPSRYTCSPQPECRVVVSPLRPAPAPGGIATKSPWDSAPTTTDKSSEAALPLPLPAPR